MVSDKKIMAGQALRRNIKRGDRYGKEPVRVSHVYVAAGDL